MGDDCLAHEMWKISVRTSVAVQHSLFSTRPGILSGPAALRGVNPR